MWKFIEAVFSLAGLFFISILLIAVIQGTDETQSEVENVETMQDSLYVYKLEPVRYGLDTLCVYADRHEPLQVNRVFLGEEETIETEYIIFIKDNKIQSCVSKYDYNVE